MADNNFKSGPGGRLKAAAANFIKPTTQDSLDLYNQALVINKFYGSNPDYKKIDETPFGKYLKHTRQNYEDLLSEPSSQFGLSLFTSPYNVKTLNQEFGTKETQKSLQNKFKNKGVFQAYPNLLGGHYDTYANPRVPPIYLHPSIKPNSVTTYESGSFMDVADVPKYDPIAVKPVSMLTLQERVEREKKYGSISPQPKPIPVIKRTVSGAIEPLQPRQAPSPIFSREEIIAPVMRPVDIPPAPPVNEPVMEEEEVVTERPVARKPPKAVMPRRAGGWANQPLLMQLFPKLYER
jgi:hypothetical protein